MLSKKMCKMCMKLTPIPNGLEKDGKPVFNRPLPWHEADEERWARGFVWCPYGGDLLNPNSEFHTKCKYKLEHMVFSDVEQKNMQEMQE